MENRVIHVSGAEAASDFAPLLDRVRAGDEVVIEHDGHPVAVLLPVPAIGDAVNGAQRDQTEFRWLALNQHRYAGCWVALEGDRLLAVGDSGREVCAAIADQGQTPLVTRVEPEDEVYFAGW
jgi:prevent-host-death family protein